MKECPFADKCTDNGERCNSCAHNPQQSYYVPKYPQVCWRYIGPSTDPWNIGDPMDPSFHTTCFSAK